MGADPIATPPPPMAFGPSLLAEVLGARGLPSPPAVALEVLRIAQDPESDDEALVQALEVDPALSARVLRAANSAYFGAPHEVRTLQAALPVLGRSAVISLALSFSLSDQAMRSGPLAEHFRRFWLRCAIQAAAAETLSRYRIPLPGPELFVTGLLLDLGQLALLKVLGPRYARILDQVRGQDDGEGGARPEDPTAVLDGGDALVALERAELGFTHAEVGASLLERWGIPATIHAVVREHHEPLPELEPAGPRDPWGGRGERASPARLAMRIASTVGDCFLRVVPTTSLTALSAHLQDRVGLPDDEVLRFLFDADVRVAEAAQLLSTDTEGRMTAAELMAEAADHWSMMALERELLTRRGQSPAIEEGQSETGSDRTADMARLRRENEQLRRQVFLDPLTRLYNRRFLDEMLRSVARETGEAGRPMAVLFLDLDRFKAVNDERGHAAGDRILVGVARRIQGMLRSGDLFARYGGEEFVILTTGTLLRGVVSLADRLRAAVEEAPFEIEGEALGVTMSIGAAVAHPREGGSVDADALLLLADQAMYASKHRGRNRITVRGMDGTLVTGANELAEAARQVAEAGVPRDRAEWGPGGGSRAQPSDTPPGLPVHAGRGDRPDASPAPPRTGSPEEEAPASPNPARSNSGGRLLRWLLRR